MPAGRLRWAMVLNLGAAVVDSYATTKVGEVPRSNLLALSFSKRSHSYIRIY